MGGVAEGDDGEAGEDARPSSQIDISEIVFGEAVVVARSIGTILGRGDFHRNAADLVELVGVTPEGELEVVIGEKGIGLSIVPRRDAAIVDLEGVDPFDHLVDEGGGFPTMLAHRLAAEGEGMGQGGEAGPVAGRIEQPQGVDPAPDHEPVQQVRFDLFAEEGFEVGRIGEIDEELEALRGPDLQCRNEVDATAFREGDGAPNLVVVGQCDSDTGLSAAVLDPVEACESVGKGGMAVQVERDHCRGGPFRVGTSLPDSMDEESPVPDLSVVIPTLDEEDCLEALLEDIAAAASVAGMVVETVVSDGGSRDSTRQIAERPGVRCVVGPAGRGPQLNRGLAAAQAGLVCLVHADCRLEEGAFGVVREFFADPENRIGMFRVRMDPPLRAHALYERAAVIDSVFTRFGDQGIVVRRAFADLLGRFPEWPLFEDVEFLRRARQYGRIRRIDSVLTTSGRRFQRLGVVRTKGINSLLILRYLMGADPERLAAAYRKGR